MASNTAIPLRLSGKIVSQDALICQPNSCKTTNVKMTCPPKIFSKIHATGTRNNLIFAAIMIARAHCVKTFSERMLTNALETSRQVKLAAFVKNSRFPPKNSAAASIQKTKRVLLASFTAALKLSTTKMTPNPSLTLSHRSKVPPSMTTMESRHHGMIFIMRRL